MHCNFSRGIRREDFCVLLAVDTCGTVDEQVFSTRSLWVCLVNALWYRLPYSEYNYFFALAGTANRSH